MTSETVKDWTTQMGVGVLENVGLPLNTIFPLSCSQTESTIHLCFSIPYFLRPIILVRHYFMGLLTFDHGRKRGRGRERREEIHRGRAREKERKREWKWEWGKRESETEREGTERTKENYRERCLNCLCFTTPWLRGCSFFFCVLTVFKHFLSAV